MRAAMGEGEATRDGGTGRVPLRSIRPADVDWKIFAAFPPGVRLAVIAGEPAGEGLYVIRVKVPADVKLMPHRHSENRIYTVMSGIFFIGVGEQFDGEALTAYPPGSVIFLPGGAPHFHWARGGEYVTQVMGVGPLGMEYLNLRDDPRSGW